MAAAMLAQNAEPTGTTADLAALGEEDEDMSEMRILEQKAAMKQHKEAMAEKAGGKDIILDCRNLIIQYNLYFLIFRNPIHQFNQSATSPRQGQKIIRD